MANDIGSNEQVRANRLDLTIKALEAGVNPLKAAEFGDRVADQLQRILKGDPKPGMQPEGGVISVVFKDAAGSLSAGNIEFDKEGNIVGIDSSRDAAEEARDNLDMAGMPEKPANYSFVVVPTMGPSR